MSLAAKTSQHIADYIEMWRHLFLAVGIIGLCYGAYSLKIGQINISFFLTRYSIFYSISRKKTPTLFFFLIILVGIASFYLLERSQRFPN